MENPRYLARIITVYNLEKYLDSSIGSNDGNGSAQSEYSQTEIVAPDGGWGWVIVLASFFMQFMGGY